MKHWYKFWKTFWNSSD